eukprot:14842583-Alexandrium_andersonii.AAC.1
MDGSAAVHGPENHPPQLLREPGVTSPGRPSRRTGADHAAASVSRSPPVPPALPVAARQGASHPSPKEADEASAPGRPAPS